MSPPNIAQVYLCSLSSHGSAMKKWARLVLLMVMARSIVVAQPMGGRLNKAVLGIEQVNDWAPALKGKRVALCVNHTSTIGKVHLVDTLISLGIKPVALWGPEHGVRGTADAGELVSSGTDGRTGLPVISLYGAKKKPNALAVAQADVVVFDMQDVGARFYTYISTLHYVMEACAEAGKKVIVLDRPTPWAHAVDGPVLDTSLRSFIGMHPIPVIHGLTMGELAHLINGQGWLKGGIKCDVEVIRVKNYTRGDAYTITVPPSPNLPNMRSIMLYPSLCLFEGTPISVGRGTDLPFQVWGSLYPNAGSYSFTPSPRKGAKDPLYNGKTLAGQNLSTGTTPKGLELTWLIEAYKTYPDTAKGKFFTPFFNKLAGTKQLAEDIKAGKTEAAIKASWQPALDAYRAMAAPYLMYGPWKGQNFSASKPK